MKRFIKLAALILGAALVFGFASCDTSTGSNEPTLYKVSYETEHGTAPKSISVEEGTALTSAQLPSLSADGYTFGGWYDGEAKAEAGSYKVTKDVTLTAQWTAVNSENNAETGTDPQTGTVTSYTVTFNTNGGSEVASQTVESGKTATEPAAPTKDGYTFGGWFTDSEFATAFNFGTAITVNTTLYAKWIDAAKTTFTVTFSVDGATSTTQTVEENGKAIKPTDPTKTGYTFAGWYNGETKFDFDTAITESITLTATWTPIAYSITYSLDGGTNASANPATYTIESETITLQNPTRAGYTFDGWFDAETGGNKVESIAQGSTGAKTFYARWSLITYSITYAEVDGATNLNTVTTYTIESDDITLSSASKTGYTFAGWKNADGEVVTKIALGTTGDITLTATWTAITYNITYSLDGGTNASANPATYTIESEDITLSDASKDGCTFGGWKNADGEVVTKIAHGSTGDITLTALWTTASGITVTIAPTSTISVVKSVSDDTITLTADSGFTGYTWLIDGTAASGMTGATVSEDGTRLTLAKANLTENAVYQVSLSATKDGIPYGAQITVTVEN